MKALRISVGLATYKVKFKKKIVADGELCNGKCDFNTKTIEVGATLDRDAQFTTLIHEALHAIFLELGYEGLSNDEALVEAVSQNLARIIRALPPELTVT